MGERVAVVGASDKPDRYAYKAFKMLQEHGHTPVPVSPKLKSLEGKPVVGSLTEIKGPVDTLTMYVSPRISSGLTSEILGLKPKRVIFNPGSENPGVIEALEAADIEVVQACTLIMLRTGQF